MANHGPNKLLIEISLDMTVTLVEGKYMVNLTMDVDSNDEEDCHSPCCL